MKQYHLYNRPNRELTDKSDIDKILYVMDECGHEYKSVVFWGDMQIVNDLHEKKHGMSILLHHLEKKDSVIKEKLLKSDDYYSKMEILKLKIGQIHGKAGR